MARRHRRRGSRRYRRNPGGDIGASVVRTAKESFSPSGFKDNAVAGVQVAAGYGVTSAWASVLGRLGGAQLLSRIPDGILRTAVGYAIKGFAVGLTGITARAAGLRGDFGANINAGAKANFGVTLARDLLGLIPGGDRVSSFLSGVGDYFSADGWPAMGDYMNASMQPTLPPPEYGPTDSIYGKTSDMYGGDGAVFN